MQGSSQLVYITKVKKNVYDFTTSIPLVICTAPNADIDGDELNFYILQDNLMANEAKTLSPHYTITDFKAGPLEINDNLSIMKPATATISNYLSSEE